MESTVYIIDDDEQVRSFVLEVVNSMGHQAKDFLSAEGFLGTPSISRPCCLLLDHELQGMSGLELQMILKESGKVIPIIAYSGKADVSTAVSMMESGAMTLLEKPCSVSSLSKAIDQALKNDAQRLEDEQLLVELESVSESLRDRERSVVDLMIQGIPNKTIAIKLKVSERTIEGDRKKIFKKFKVETAPEVAVKITLLESLRLRLRGSSGSNDVPRDDDVQKDDAA